MARPQLTGSTRLVNEDVRRVFWPGPPTAPQGELTFSLSVQVPTSRSATLAPFHSRNILLCLAFQIPFASLLILLNPEIDNSVSIENVLLINIQQN